MLIGYARVSTDDQTLDQQRAALKAAGCKRINRNEMSGAIPADVPVELARTARSTLVGAVDAATLLPGDTGRALLTLAREAFNYGFYAVAALSAIGMLAGAIVTLTALRNVRRNEGAAHKGAKLAFWLKYA